MIKAKPIIVLTYRGKGKGTKPDYIIPKLFNSKELAEEYIKLVTDLESKYWAYAEIVGDGETVEPFN